MDWSTNTANTIISSTHTSAYTRTHTHTCMRTHTRHSSHLLPPLISHFQSLGRPATDSVNTHQPLRCHGDGLENRCNYFSKDKKNERKEEKKGKNHTIATRGRETDRVRDVCLCVCVGALCLWEQQRERVCACTCMFCDPSMNQCVNFSIFQTNMQMWWCDFTLYMSFFWPHIVKSIYYPPLKTLNGYANICICYCEMSAGGLADPFLKGCFSKPTCTKVCITHMLPPCVCVCVCVSVSGLLCSAVVWNWRG